MTWECVYTVSEYYDGPRRGVADFRGRPHVYESQFSDLQDGYTDRFLLTEIDSEFFDSLSKIGRFGFVGALPSTAAMYLSIPTQHFRRTESAIGSWNSL